MKESPMPWLVVQTYMPVPSAVARFINKDQALIYFDALRRIDQKNAERYTVKHELGSKALQEVNPTQVAA